VNRDATTAFARTIVDEWARAGVRHAVVAPGSRSTPLALALAEDRRVRLHVVLDERSAGFFALGVGKAAGVPAIALCTSGTAAAGFHAAVLEASHARVPLLVCTADRPPELHGVGAPQTMDQAGLYGVAPRLAVDVAPPEDRPGVGNEWRSLAARAFAAACGRSPGPVHLNLAFREPLVPTGAPLVDAPGRADGRPWTVVEHGSAQLDDGVLDSLAARVAAAPRGLVGAGWGAQASPASVERFADAAGWPLLADPLSNLRSAGAISTYGALFEARAALTAEPPDLVLRLGAMPTSKPLSALLAPPATVVRLDPSGSTLDPNFADGDLLVADPDQVLDALSARLTRSEAPGWLEQWTRTERVARRALDEYLDGVDPMFEGRIARDVLASLPDGTDFLVASSMPVRDLDTFGAARDGVQVLANRGVNGIDGLVSTGLGMAAADPERPAAALLGDLAFLHDSNGLLGAGGRDLDVVFVVVDNDGGGIFSFLPQAGLPEHFEELFGTPHGIDVGALAAVHEIPVDRVDRPDRIGPAVREAVETGGVRVVHARTDRRTNVGLHRRAVDAVARALEASG
jgi:2-succinyl-5-enolpyruvyl-6-hydroxy-3-cyclohexene-1-carboxylate synthase